MNLKRTLTVTLAVAAITTASLAAPKRTAPVRRSVARTAPVVPRQFDPKSYAASVEGVDCSNVATRASSVVPIEKPFRGLAKSYPYGPPAKSEFETQAAYDTRIGEDIKVKLGGTDRIVAVIPIKDILKYDADSSMVTIDPVDKQIKESAIAVKVFSDLDDGSSYVGSNTYGASAKITRQTFTQFYFILPARGRTLIKAAMPADTARSLKENGSLVLVGTTLSPYIAYERQRGRPTISDPNDVTYLQFYLGMIAQCAVVVNGGQEIARLKL